MMPGISSETLEIARSGDPFSGSVLACVIWETDTADRVLEHVPRLKAAVEAEAGCISFDVARTLENPTRFLVLERYANLAAFDAHRQTPHFREIMQERIAPLLTRREVVLHQL